MPLPRAPTTTPCCCCTSPRPRRSRGALFDPFRMLDAGLRGHNVIANVMVGGYLGSYFFDDFQVTNNQFISPPPSPPSPPPSPPPHVLMQLSLESYQKGSINSQVRAPA